MNPVPSRVTATAPARAAARCVRLADLFDAGGRSDRRHAAPERRYGVLGVMTVQLSTRVSPDVRDIIDQAAAATGRSKRDLVQEAIRNAAWR